MLFFVPLCALCVFVVTLFKALANVSEGNLLCNKI